VDPTPRAGLLGPAEIRGLAESLGIRPSKSRGQNFVIDPNTVRRIAAAGELTQDDVVLEVGPGLGSLTLAMLPLVAKVIAVEIEPAFAAALPDTVASHAPFYAGRLEVITADALRIDGLSAAPTALVANLPYNVAVPVLLHLLEVVPSLRQGLVMVQAEVADRLTAAPGSRVYGAPTVKLAWWAKAERAGSVPRGVFWPVPNVDSGLVRFRCEPPPTTTASRAEVFAVVDAAFAQRRKMLRAVLAGWAGSSPAAEAALVAAGVDPTWRGERLDVEAFTRIAEQGPKR
jgi:16S rRNA (adenine1518-N6/adenine1519-N6)-dimethyltransferase